MINKCHDLEGLISLSNISLKPLKPNLASKLPSIGQKITNTEWRLLMIINKSICSRVKSFNLRSIREFTSNHSLIK